MKKIIVGFCMIALIGLETTSIVSFANEATEISYMKIVESSMEPQADVVEWRYKTVDNKIYRRRYNSTKKQWIGDWEFFAYVQ